MSAGAPATLASLSAAMDGGFIAIADVADAMSEIGATTDHRLIGGVAVLLHIQRLGLDLPLRATGDADFGVPPYLLKSRRLFPQSRHAATARLLGIGGSDASTIGASPRSICWFLRTRRGLDRPNESVTS